jgi:plastocyanin
LECGWLNDVLESVSILPEGSMTVARWACVVVTSALLGCGGGGDDDGGTNPPPPPPPPNNQTLGSISTNVTSLNLVAGNTQTITVSAFDTQGGVIVNFGTPTFTVVSSTVAEVDAGGTVLGLSGGSTTINVSVTMGAVTRTAPVAVVVTGSLPTLANVSTQSGDIFTPAKVAISQGGQVTWTFGGVEHTVVFSNAGAPGGITSGGYSSSHSRTFGSSGNFNYVCTIHAGMSGQVIVR